MCCVCCVCCVLCVLCVVCVVCCVLCVLCVLWFDICAVFVRVGVSYLCACRHVTLCLCVAMAVSESVRCFESGCTTQLPRMWPFLEQSGALGEDSMVLAVQ